MKAFFIRRIEDVVFLSVFFAAMSLFASLLHNVRGA